MADVFQQRLNRRDECKIKVRKIRGKFGLQCTRLRGLLINIGGLKAFFDH